MAAFKDLFSTQSAIYVQARPGYPKELFDFIINLCEEHELAWDCATGNGQAALPLADFFSQVWATDASQRQIEHAIHKANIEYKVRSASDSGLKNNSADLVTVATAIHWLPIKEFYAEAERVLKPGGILAYWGYWNPKVNPDVNIFLQSLSKDFLRDYWAPEVYLVANKYAELPPFFPLIQAPQFQTKAYWTYDQLKAYILSWSATQSYFKSNGEQSLDAQFEVLKGIWQNPEEKKEICWDIYLKVSRKPKI